MLATKKKAIFAMHPREPLTKKAFAAIFAYANHRAEIKMQGYRMGYLMCQWSVEAERMPRQRLYAYLEKRGYCWRPELGSWEKQK